MVERKSGYALIAKVINKTADSVGSAIINKLSPLAPLVKTITFDNVLNARTFSSDRQSHPVTAICS
jgi:IS30 family transposase